MHKGSIPFLNGMRPKMASTWSNCETFSIEAVEITGIAWSRERFLMSATPSHLAVNAERMWKSKSTDTIWVAHQKSR
jgi:hypothetical protein